MELSNWNDPQRSHCKFIVDRTAKQKCITHLAAHCAFYGLSMTELQDNVLPNDSMFEQGTILDHASRRLPLSSDERQICKIRQPQQTILSRPIRGAYQYEFIYADAHHVQAGHLVVGVKESYCEVRLSLAHRIQSIAWGRCHDCNFNIWILPAKSDKALR